MSLITIIPTNNHNANNCSTCRWACDASAECGGWEPNGSANRARVVRRPRRRLWGNTPEFYWDSCCGRYRRLWRYTSRILDIAHAAQRRGDNPLRLRAEEALRQLDWLLSGDASIAVYFGE